MAVSPPEIAPNRAHLFLVIGIIDTGQRELAQRGEMALDPVEPGGIRRGVDEFHVVRRRPILDLPPVMRGKVIKHNIKPFLLGIPGAKIFEKIKQRAPGLATFAVAQQQVLLEVERRKEHPRPLVAMVGRRQPSRFAALRPVTARIGPDLQRTELVQTNYPPVFRRMVVELLDSFFLASNSGSFDSFHVLVRW